MEPKWSPIGPQRAPKNHTNPTQVPPGRAFLTPSGNPPKIHRFWGRTSRIEFPCTWEHDFHLFPLPSKWFQNYLPKASFWAPFGGLGATRCGIRTMELDRYPNGISTHGDWAYLSRYDTQVNCGHPKRRCKTDVMRASTVSQQRKWHTLQQGSLAPHWLHMMHHATPQACPVTATSAATGAQEPW